MSELSILFPKPETVDVNGRKVRIKPVSFADFQAFGKASPTIISMACSQSSEQLYAHAARSGQLQDILGRATSLPAWRIRRLPASVAVSLMLHVIRVNSGFFEAALVDADKALAGAGLSAA